MNESKNALSDRVTLRPTTPTDTKFAINAHRAAYHDVVVEQFGEWNEEAQTMYFDIAWAHPGFEIVSYDGVECGYYRIEELSKAIKAHELVLLPEFQGKGIGTALLNRIQKQAAEEQIPVQLQVLKANRAMKLYERLGFSIVAETDAHYQMEWRPPTTL